VDEVHWGVEDVCFPADGVEGQLLLARVAFKVELAQRVVCVGDLLEVESKKQCKVAVVAAIDVTDDR